MNLFDIMRLFLEGQRDLLPEEIRLQIIKQVQGARRAVVKYVHRETCCPVCRVFGMSHNNITVRNTSGEVRYCECLRCGANFQAVGETAAELAIEAATFLVVKPQQKKKNTKRKRR